MADLMGKQENEASILERLLERPATSVHALTAACNEPPHIPGMHCVSVLRPELIKSATNLIQSYAASQPTKHG